MGQVGSTWRRRLALDRDPVVIGTRAARKRVRARNGPWMTRDVEPEREILAGPEGRQRLAVRRHEIERSAVVALGRLAIDQERTEPGPARGSNARLGLAQGLLEIAAPTVRQVARGQDALERLRLVHVVEISLDELGDRDGLVVAVDQFDRIADADIALLADPEVETNATTPLEAYREVESLGHADRQPVTGDARLSDLEQRSADPEQVAHAGRILSHARDGEVLAELTERQVATPELRFPEPVVLVGIRIHGHIDAAMGAKIRLAV